MSDTVSNVPGGSSVPESASNGAGPVAVPKAWPFEEAQKVARRLVASGKTHALFETGYGPSGLPHIGTFGEVARTTWVRHAFTELTGLPSRLLAFSDDMDGLRKVPDNVPNKDMLAQHLGQAVDANTRPVRHARQLWRPQQRSAAGHFSIRLALTMNLPRLRNIMRPGVSMPP